MFWPTTASKEKGVAGSTWTRSEFFRLLTGLFGLATMPALEAPANTLYVPWPTDPWEMVQLRLPESYPSYFPGDHVEVVMPDDEAMSSEAKP